MAVSQKIGVLTFHKCINYGAYWQARCLVEGLQSRGNAVTLLNYRSLRITRQEWMWAVHRGKPRSGHRPTWAQLFGKLARFIHSQSQLPYSRPFSINRPKTMEEFDLIVVGSDEVWNFHNPWYRGDPLFFGAGLRAARWVSYAASFGSYPASDKLPKGYADLLRDFSEISVRDNNSRVLVRDSTGADPQLVLDPCLLWTPAPKTSTPVVRTPYAVVYGSNFSDEFVRQTIQWSRDQNVRLLSLGYFNSWAHENRLATSPSDFAHLVRDSRAVATNFFHGCIFALRFAIPFVCEAEPYRWIRMRDLLDTVGDPTRMKLPDTNRNDLENQLNRPIEKAVLSRIESLRSISHNYLDRALN